jgi:hypothetical protein
LQALKDNRQRLRFGGIHARDRLVAAGNVADRPKVLAAFSTIGLLHGDFQSYDSCRRGTCLSTIGIEHIDTLLGMTEIDAPNKPKVA